MFLDIFDIFFCMAVDAAVSLNRSVVRVLAHFGTQVLRPLLLAGCFGNV